MLGNVLSALCILLLLIFATTCEVGTILTEKQRVLAQCHKTIKGQSWEKSRKTNPHTHGNLIYSKRGTQTTGIMMN